MHGQKMTLSTFLLFEKKKELRMQKEQDPDGLFLKSLLHDGSKNSKSFKKMTSGLTSLLVLT